MTTETKHPTCRDCGQRLLFLRPGRDVCARCRPDLTVYVPGTGWVYVGGDPS